MISGAERISSTGENTQTSAEKHPLEDMPSFEEHMRQIESSELGSLNLEQLNESDKTIDNLFDRIGRGAGEGYFSDPDKLLNLTKDATMKTPKEAIADFRDQINTYKARSTENYQARAESFLEDTRDNVRRLTKDGLVGSDVVKVFLDPQFISRNGRGMLMNEYNTIQTDYSRQEEKTWMDKRQTFERLKMRAQLVADSLFENVGDVAYQAEVSGIDTTYDPNKGIVLGDFIHVNSKKPREKGGFDVISLQIRLRILAQFYTHGMRASKTLHLKIAFTSSLLLHLRIYLMTNHAQMIS